MKFRNCNRNKTCQRSCRKTKNGYTWLSSANMHEGGGWIPCEEYWELNYTDKERGLEKFGKPKIGEKKNERK